MWTEETFQLVRDGIDAAKKCRSIALRKNIKNSFKLGRSSLMIYCLLLQLTL